MLDKEKARLNDVLNNESGDALGWAVTIFIVVLIVISVAVAILDTLEELPAEVKTAFYLIEVVTLLIFTVEYGLRLWSCTADKEFHDPLKGDSSTLLRRLPSSTLSPFFRRMSPYSPAPQQSTSSFCVVFGSYAYFVSSSWGGTTTLSQW
jgi:hypothetical protein